MFVVIEVSQKVTQGLVNRMSLSSIIADMQSNLTQNIAHFIYILQMVSVKDRKWWYLKFRNTFPSTVMKSHLESQFTQFLINFYYVEGQSISVEKSIIGKAALSTFYAFLTLRQNRLANTSLWSEKPILLSIDCAWKCPACYFSRASVDASSYYSRLTDRKLMWI